MWWIPWILLTELGSYPRNLVCFWLALRQREFCWESDRELIWASPPEFCSLQSGGRQSTKCLFFQCQCQRLTYNLGVTSNKHRTSKTHLLINANNAVGEMNLLTSLFQSGFWLFVRCNASISGNWFYLFVRNIWLTGNILGSDLFRLIPRCRGGFRLVLVTSLLFLSFMASFTQFFFWSTWWAGKSLSRAKTSQT